MTREDFDALVSRRVRRGRDHLVRCGEIFRKLPGAGICGKEVCR